MFPKILNFPHPKPNISSNISKPSKLRRLSVRGTPSSKSNPCAIPFRVKWSAIAERRFLEKKARGSSREICKDKKTFYMFCLCDQKNVRRKVCGAHSRLARGSLSSKMGWPRENCACFLFGGWAKICI